MATITFSFTHPAGDFARTYTIPDAHLGRLVAVYKAEYERVRIAFGSTPVPLTNAQVLDKLTQETIADWKARVLRQERDDAVLPPIDAT